MMRLAKAAMRGVPVVASDNVEFHLYFMLESYISNLPKAEDFLSVEHGSRTYTPCHLCRTKKEDFSDCTTTEARALPHTSYLLQRPQSYEDKTKAEEDLKNTL